MWKADGYGESLRDPIGKRQGRHATTAAAPRHDYAAGLLYRARSREEHIKSSWTSFVCFFLWLGTGTGEASPTGCPFITVRGRHAKRTCGESPEERKRVGQPPKKQSSYKHQHQRRTQGRTYTNPGGAAVGKSTKTEATEPEGIAGNNREPMPQRKLQSQNYQRTKVEKQGGLKRKGNWVDDGRAHSLPIVSSARVCAVPTRSRT